MEILSASLRDKGHQVEERNPLQYPLALGSSPTRKLDKEQPRLIPRLGWLSYPRGLRVVQQAEAWGWRTLNTSITLQLLHDKWATAACWQREGLPVVPQLLIQPDNDDTSSQLRKLNWTGPLIVKLLTGSQGKGVARILEAREVSAWIDLLRTAKQEFLIQPSIQGPEIRSLWFRGRELSSFERRGAPTDFRRNVQMGGQLGRVNLTAAESEILKRAQLALRADFVGFDFFRCPEQGTLLLEANAFPGLSASVTADAQLLPQLVAALEDI